MPDIGEKIIQLQARLDKMVEYQDYFYRETNQIRAEIKSLKQSAATAKTETSDVNFTSAEKPPVAPVAENIFSESVTPRTEPAEYQPPVFDARENQTASRSETGIEEFIGRNLISLIGIIITIIGVGIGAKYAIDRDLISPATRILSGYAFAAVLLGIAVWLKSKYLNFSAVLLSGALAMMYFLTFFAYSFYSLIPQKAAFLIMLVVTASTVGAALNYSRQVIAHIGLVGAYAVPFLLSENSGRADVLFGYMTIINFGILVISVKKFWKPLYYSSFIFTWLIYAAWFFTKYRADEHFALAFGFAFVFFLTFYLTFLSYKLIAQEEFNAEIVVLVLVNSFIFYGFGYATLASREDFAPYLGAFTLFNALINFIFAAVIHRYQLGDRRNFYLVIALAITFVTIAVPVQLTGNWVTLIWTAEAALLFWIGRTKQLAIYENLAYPLMVLASLSLLNDWQNALYNQAITTPIYNRNFLTTILFAAAFGFMTFVNRDEKYESSVKEIGLIVNFAVATIFLFVLYNAFRTEIGVYYQGQTANSAVEIISISEFNAPLFREDGNLQIFNIIWQINYSMLFFTLLSFVNIKKIKSATLGFINLGLNALVLFVFLTAGLYLLNELRTNYFAPVDAQVFPPGIFHILIRYVAFGFVAALIYASYKYIKQEFLHRSIAESALDLIFDCAFYVSILWIASSELINWMDVFGYRDSYKLGLSIFWGIYALLLIGLGIFQRKTHLRVGAIGLFALTLAKLFFYDIADLDTISKTVVFVSLGVLLLIISFLYNKYKDLIFEKDAER